MADTDTDPRAWRWSRVYRWIWRTMPGESVRVWCCLADHAGDRNEAYPATETIAAELDLSAATVKRHLSALVKAGAITKIGKNGSVNLYSLCDEPRSPATYPKEANGSPVTSTQVISDFEMTSTQVTSDLGLGHQRPTNESIDPRTSSRTTHSKSLTEREELAGKLDIPPTRVGPLLRWLAESAAADKWRHLATDHDQLVRMWRFTGGDGGNLLRATVKRSLFDDLDREDARAAAARKELEAARADRARREKAGPMSEEERERRRLAARRFTG